MPGCGPGWLAAANGTSANQMRAEAFMEPVWVFLPLSPRCLSWKEPGAETGARTAAWVGQSAATLRPRDRGQQRGAACLQPWLIEASGFVSSLSMFAFPSSSAPPMTLCPARHLFSKFNFTIL